MKNQTVLVTGSSGLVGSYLLPELVSQYESVYVTSHLTTPTLGSPIDIDLSAQKLLVDMLENINPEIIVNLVALTNVDACEKNKKYAFQLNAVVPKIISDYLKAKRLKGESRHYLLHISTDYVFDGRNGHYREESKPNPINWYGRTKFIGEQEIVRNLGDKGWCIARISTPFGVHQKKESFPIFLINKVRMGEKVNVVKDQFTSPSYSLDLAKMLVEIIERRISNIIHVASRSRISRYEQAMKVAQVFELNAELIVGCTSASMNWLAARPADSSLDVSKASQFLSNKPRNFDECIRDFALEFYKI